MLLYFELYTKTDYIMNKNIRSILHKNRKFVVLSVVAIALAVYIAPFDLFTNQATAAPGDNPYGKPRQGPPSNTPGGVPGERSQGQGPPEERGPPAPRGQGSPEDRNPSDPRGR